MAYFTMTSGAVASRPYFTHTLTLRGRGLKTCTRIVALKDKCLHPTLKEPYIRSITGGRDFSIEEMQVCMNQKI